MNAPLIPENLEKVLVYARTEWPRGSRVTALVVSTNLAAKAKTLCHPQEFCAQPLQVREDDELADDAWFLAGADPIGEGIMVELERAPFQGVGVYGSPRETEDLMSKKAPLTECPGCGFTAAKRAELTALLDHEHAAHTLGGSDGGSPRRLAPEARDRRITLGTEAGKWNTCPEAQGLHLDLMAEVAARALLLPILQASPAAQGLHLDMLTAAAAAQKEEVDGEAEVQAPDDASGADVADGSARPAAEADGEAATDAGAASEAGGEVKKGRGRKAAVREPVALEPVHQD